jgi:hypothetical protein
MWSFATLYKLFYFLYILYLVTLAVGFEDFMTMTACIWIIVTISIFLMIYALVLIASGAKSTHLVDLSPVTVLVGAGIILALIGIVMYYLQRLTYNHLQEKIQNTNLTALTYQYGRQSDDIIARLGLHNFNVFLQDEPLEVFYKESLPRSKQILKNICGSSFNEPEPVRMDLLWYLFISDQAMNNNLTREERNYILNCPTQRLLELLGPNYLGAPDRASVLFALFSGQMVERPLNMDRYDNVKNYRSNILWNLARYQHQLIDHITGTYSTKGPVLLLASTGPSYMETLLNNIPNEDLNSLIGRMGLVKQQSIEQIQDDISLYYNVFTRPHNLGLPPDLYVGQVHVLEEILSYYTNEELVTAYEPREVWGSREALMQTIKHDLLGIPKWSIQSVNYCTNDDTMNILTTELHREVNKLDPLDPTLSYGVHKNYRCYQTSELVASFREYDGVFGFRIPDWTDGARELITNELLPREFSIDSIKDLAHLIDESDLEALKQLGTVIRTGLNSMGELSIKLKSLKNQYYGFNEDQKRIVNLYLSWLFTYAMWMRFWKGPGYIWPMKKININNPIARNNWDRASPTERDEHIFIQHAIRSRIMDLYETDPGLKAFIDGLPVIYYEFDTTEARLASYPVKETIDKIVNGRHCMGFGSDTILKTAYYYITHLIPSIDQKGFDTYIIGMFPEIFELERNVIESQIIRAQPNTIRYDVLQNRIHALRQPLPIQPGFVPGDYQNNIHTDNPR